MRVCIFIPTLSFLSCTNAQYTFVLFNKTPYTESERNSLTIYGQKGEKHLVCAYFMEFRFATLFVLLLLFIQDNEKHWKCYLGYFTLYISLTLNVLTLMHELSHQFFPLHSETYRVCNDQWTICIWHFFFSSAWCIYIIILIYGMIMLCGMWRMVLWILHQKYFSEL